MWSKVLLGDGGGCQSGWESGKGGKEETLIGKDSFSMAIETEEADTAHPRANEDYGV